MKYVIAFGGGSLRAQQPLEAGSTRESVAKDCREASLSFMSGVAKGWDKLDLARWLTGPYAHATRHAKRGERVVPLDAPSCDSDSDESEITAATIEALVTRVRGQLLASLEQAALQLGSLDFTDEAIERHLIRKVVDGDGGNVWIPVDAPRLRLRDRLRSLFAADYLNAPYTYAELFVCHRCEAVVFDDHAKRIGVCGEHRLSGFVQSNIEGVASSRPGAGAR